MKDWTVPWLRVPPNVPTGRNIGKRTVESLMRSDSNAAQSCRAAKPDNTMIPKGKAASIAALGLDQSAIEGLLDTGLCNVKILIVALDSDEVTASFYACNASCAATEERVKHRIAGIAPA